jgi:hypothetical protein
MLEDKIVYGILRLCLLTILHILSLFYYPKNNKRRLIKDRNMFLRLFNSFIALITTSALRHKTQLFFKNLAKLFNLFNTLISLVNLVFLFINNNWVKIIQKINTSWRQLYADI